VTKAILVAPEIELGSKVIQMLDKAGIRLNVALWAVFEEDDDWRFAVCSRGFREGDRRTAYLSIRTALEDAGLPFRSIPNVMILVPRDPFVKELRALFASSANVEGVRITSQRIGDRIIEDAYVYRIE